MALQIAGQTTHFIVRYDDAVGAPALAVANSVLRQCEADLLRLSFYMPFRLGGAGDPFTHPPIDIQIVNDPLGGPGFSSADNNGSFPGRQSRIRINPFSAPGVMISDDFAGFAFVAEMAELIMAFNAWDAGSSQGEALSRVMAEELHPSSTSNWVNTWLGWPRPRPDWITQNEPSGGALVRGDLDQIAFGCGMIFIYFLRYQLGFPYDQIINAGGSLLSDRYRRLTGANDDPAARVNKLLDDHFGNGTINLVSNNPFPLYEGAARQVSFAFGKPVAHTSPLVESGHAHVQPFFNCPAADYPYKVYSQRVTQAVTATTRGIGLPTFQWRINGKLLTGSGSGALGDTVSAQVDVPDPQRPSLPQHQTETFAFDYQIKDIFDAAGGRSTLTLTNRSSHGDYRLDIQVEADETAVPTGAVTAKQSLTLRTRTVVYGGSYGADQERCEKAFEHAIAGRVRVQESLNLLLTLPDPPPPDYLTKVLEAVAHIQEEIAHLAGADHATATKIARYAAIRVGVPAHVFLKDATIT
jgi:hypothetical protein